MFIHTYVEFPNNSQVRRRVQHSEGYRSSRLVPRNVHMRTLIRYDTRRNTMVYTYKLLFGEGQYKARSISLTIFKQSIQIVLLVCFSYRRKRIYLIMHSSHRAVAGGGGWG